MNRYGGDTSGSVKMLGRAVVASVVLAAGCASAPTPAMPHDPLGEWHVRTIHVGTQARAPARDFVVRFSIDPGDPDLFHVGLSGINSHSSSLRVQGESLTPQGMATQTLIGCGIRAAMESSDDDARKLDACRATAADEDLIGDVLAHATSWRDDGDRLLLRSNPEDVWIELHREPL